MGPEAIGINLLRLWWNATPLSALKLSTFSDAVDYYQKKGSFLAELGKLTKSIELGKIQVALEKMGRRFGSVYPPTSEFFQAVADYAGVVSVGEVAEAAGDGLKDAGGAIAKLAASGVLLYVAIAAVGAFVLPKILSGRSARSHA